MIVGIEFGPSLTNNIFRKSHINHLALPNQGRHFE